MNASTSVSVVIPTFNRAPVLKRALQSVLAQTQLPAEIFVIDDGSTDETAAMIASLQNRLICHLRIENRGAAAARNRGVHEATGCWIAFLDSDDFWKPNKLEAQLQAIHRAQLENETFVSFHQVIVRDENTDEGRPFRAPESGEKISDYLFRSGGLIQTSSLLIPRKILQQIPFDETLSLHQDWDLCLRLEAGGVKFFFVPQPLAIWSCGNNIDRVSIKGSTAQSTLWLEQKKAMFTPLAKEAFVAETLAPRFYAEGKKKKALQLIFVAGLHRAISLKTTCRLLCRILLPATLYNGLRKIPARLRSWRK